MFLNIIRNGQLGDLLHGEAAYIHDLRFQMNEETRGTGSGELLNMRREEVIYTLHMDLDQYHSI